MTVQEMTAPGHILVIEDHPDTARTLRDLLQLSRYTVTLAHDRTTAAQAIAEQPPDLVIIDVHLPRQASYQICSWLKETMQTRLIPVLLISASYNQREHLQSITVGADDYLCMLRDGQLFEARVAALLQVKRRNDWLEPAEQVVLTLARVAATRHTITAERLQRRGTAARWLGTRLGLAPSDLMAANYGAMVQDVGMIGVSEALLHKHLPLTRAEQQQIERHTQIGAHIVQPLRMAALVAPIVRSHHERWDGRGYPDGLVGTAIPLGARIVAVVNALDTLTTPRPGAPPLDLSAILTHLRAGAGSRWDPQIIAALVDLLVDAGIPAHNLNVKTVHDKQHPTRASGHADGAGLNQPYLER